MHDREGSPDGVVAASSGTLTSSLAWRLLCGLLGMVLFLVAVVGLGLAVFTWIGNGSATIIVYDLISALSTFGLGYIFLKASASGSRFWASPWGG